nr:uncharacterized protein CTRU02_13202 [Colletotrichum truncatum]KAF6783694.1 hypothetical protein CTRU02_13202 [Colletotrichum truncatum]
MLEYVYSVLPTLSKFSDPLTLQRNSSAQQLFTSHFKMQLHALTTITFLCALASAAVFPDPKIREIQSLKNRRMPCPPGIDACPGGQGSCPKAGEFCALGHCCA